MERKDKSTVTGMKRNPGNETLRGKGLEGAEIGHRHQSSPIKADAPFLGLSKGEMEAAKVFAVGPMMVDITDEADSIRLEMEGMKEATIELESEAFVQGLCLKIDGPRQATNGLESETFRPETGPIMATENPEILIQRVMITFLEADNKKLRQQVEEVASIERGKVEMTMHTLRSENEQLRRQVELEQNATEAAEKLHKDAFKSETIAEKKLINKEKELRTVKEKVKALEIEKMKKQDQLERDQRKLTEAENARTAAKKELELVSDQLASAKKQLKYDKEVKAQNCQKEAIKANLSAAEKKTLSDEVELLKKQLRIERGLMEYKESQLQHEKNLRKFAEEELEKEKFQGQRLQSYLLQSRIMGENTSKRG